jgi:hypothetical protein
MNRLIRTVGVQDWPVSDALGARKDRLSDVPEPKDLLDSVIAQAETAAQKARILLRWQPACERQGYFRVEAQIPIEETTFDHLFNGRSGYRAQYYLSPEEGILYNRDIVCGLVRSIEVAYAKQYAPVPLVLLIKSLMAPHSKIWVFGRFDHPIENAINPRRWVENGSTRGRKAPLPSNCAIDVKGSFIHPQSDNDLFVDELKLSRALDLFYRGYT